MLPEYMKTARFVIPGSDAPLEEFERWADKILGLPWVIQVVDIIDQPDGGVEFDIEVSVNRETDLDEIQSKLMEIMKASEVQHGG